MNESQIRHTFPKASQSFIDANCVLSGSESEQAVCHGPLAKEKRKRINTGRSIVSIVSYRRIRLDPDNLCPKYFIDSLRYAGLIHDDREEDILYQISQKKVEKKTQEKTLIEITK